MTLPPLRSKENDMAKKDRKLIIMILALALLSAVVCSGCKFQAVPSNPTGSSPSGNPTGTSDPTVPTGPTEPSAEPTEPTEPTEPSVEPTEPTEPTEPSTEPTESTEPGEDPDSGWGPLI